MVLIRLVDPFLYIFTGFKMVTDLTACLQAARKAVVEKSRRLREAILSVLSRASSNGICALCSAVLREIDYMIDVRSGMRFIRERRSYSGSLCSECMESLHCSHCILDHMHAPVSDSTISAPHRHVNPVTISGTRSKNSRSKRKTAVVVMRNDELEIVNGQEWDMQHLGAAHAQTQTRRKVKRMLRAHRMGVVRDQIEITIRNYRQAVERGEFEDARIFQQLRDQLTEYLKELEQIPG